MSSYGSDMIRYPFHRQLCTTRVQSMWRYHMTINAKKVESGENSWCL